MAEIQEVVTRLNAMFLTMKLPDSIKDLPKFSGSKHTLHDFITNVDEIIEQCEEQMGKGNTPITFLRAIRNKITDEADEVLSAYGPTVSWAQIKNHLTTHYSDKRNETSLIRDLHNIFQNDNSIEKFYSQIIDIQSTIINNVRLSNSLDVVKDTKETLYREMCLATFLRGLAEPMGSLIRARKPGTLSEALTLCIEEQNIIYIKKRPNLTHSVPPISRMNKPLIYNSLSQNTPSRQFPQRPMNSNNVYYNHKPFPRFTNQTNPNSPPRQYTYQPPQFFRNNFNQNKQYNNRQFFGNNFNGNHKPPPIPPRNGRPEMMDTTSNSNGYKQPFYKSQQPPHPPNYNFHPTGPPRFQSRELFNLENPQLHDFVFNPQYNPDDFNFNPQYNPDDYNYNPQYNPDCNDYPNEMETYTPYSNPEIENVSSEPDETVFQVKASETQLDT